MSSETSFTGPGLTQSVQMFPWNCLKQETSLGPEMLRRSSWHLFSWLPGEQRQEVRLTMKTASLIFIAVLLGCDWATRLSGSSPVSIKSLFWFQQKWLQTFLSSAEKDELHSKIKASALVFHTLHILGWKSRNDRFSLLKAETVVSGCLGPDCFLLWVSFLQTVMGFLFSDVLWSRSRPC